MGLWGARRRRGADGCAVLCAAAALTACQAQEPPPPSPVVAICAPGDVARSVPGEMSPGEGWMRIALQPCPGAMAEGPLVLEVAGATHSFVFTPGRRNGETLGVLSGTEPTTQAVQTHGLTGVSPRTRTVVLGPWAGGSPRPVIGALRLRLLKARSGSLGGK